MARKSNVVYSKLRPLTTRRCPDCGGSNIGPVTRCCFDCHDAELRKAGVDLTPIRQGLGTRTRLVMINRNIRRDPKALS